MNCALACAPKASAFACACVCVRMPFKAKPYELLFFGFNLSISICVPSESKRKGMKRGAGKESALFIAFHIGSDEWEHSRSALLLAGPSCPRRASVFASAGRSALAPMNERKSLKRNKAEKIICFQFDECK